jgi:hypothetical protein
VDLGASVGRHEPIAGSGRDPAHGLRACLGAGEYGRCGARRDRGGRYRGRPPNGQRGPHDDQHPPCPLPRSHRTPTARRKPQSLSLMVCSGLSTSSRHVEHAHGDASHVSPPPASLPCRQVCSRAWRRRNRGCGVGRWS